MTVISQTVKKLKVISTFTIFQSNPILKDDNKGFKNFEKSKIVDPEIKRKLKEYQKVHEERE